MFTAQRVGRKNLKPSPIIVYYITFHHKYNVDRKFFSRCVRFSPLLAICAIPAKHVKLQDSRFETIITK